MSSWLSKVLLVNDWKAPDVSMLRALSPLTLASITSIASDTVMVGAYRVLSALPDLYCKGKAPKLSTVNFDSRE